MDYTQFNFMLHTMDDNFLYFLIFKVSGWQQASDDLKKSGNAFYFLRHVSTANLV